MYQEKLISIKNEILRKRGFVLFVAAKHQMPNESSRKQMQHEMRNFLQRAEWFECCQTSRNGNSTSNCSWGISASVQVDSYSKPTITVFGFCSAIGIETPQRCPSKHTLLIFSGTKTPVIFLSRFINEWISVFHACQMCSIHALQFLFLQSEGSC